MIETRTCPLALRERHLSIRLLNYILGKLCLIEIQRAEFELVATKDLLWIRT